MTKETEPARSPRATVRCPFCLKLNRVNVARALERPRCGECGRPILLDRPLGLRGDDLDRLVHDAEVPLLIDFYADWCAPCKVMAPVLDELARERAGELLVAKLDTDRSPELSQRLGIRGIPTLILFRDGVEVDRIAGAVPAGRLREWLDETNDG